MKKMLLVMLAVCLTAVFSVGCGVPGMTPLIGAGTAGEPDDDVGNEDLILEDDGSDVTFNPDDIILPGQTIDGDYSADLNMGVFFQVGGRVMSVETIDGRTHIEVEDSNGNPAILIVCDETTVFPFEKTVEVGDMVTGWHSAVFLAAIYPPQYNVEVLAAGAPDDVMIRVDRFSKWDAGPDENYMISSNGMFVFTTDENTEIVLQDGQAFAGGDLENRNIIVIYDVSTRSIPEQATANKLIVLFEEITGLA